MNSVHFAHCILRETISNQNRMFDYLQIKLWMSQTVILLWFRHIVRIMRNVNNIQRKREYCNLFYYKK